MKKGEYFRQEISRGMFSRTIGFPADVEASKAKASFKNGMLELSIPKGGEIQTATHLHRLRDR